MPKQTAQDRAKRRAHAKAKAKQQAQGMQAGERGKIGETNFRAFKNETLALFRAAWDLDPAVLSEEQASDQGRLACVLSFLTTLTREVMQNEASPFQREDNPRLRLAHEAYCLLRSIKDDQRTLLDNYFAGAGKKGTPSYQIDKHVEAILSACILRLESINPDRQVTRVDMYGWMRGNDGLSPYMSDVTDGALTTMYHEHKRTKGGQSQYYRDLYEGEGLTDTKSVIERAAHDVGLRKNPLSMDWATKVVIRDSTYSDGKGNELFLSAETKRRMLYPSNPSGRAPNVSAGQPLLLKGPAR
ncbi:hypothetical protein R1A27_34545 (plasmid) [Methylobacterium sp. NMS12]|uniref:hypothetical protein n=1 Tax=Methylobacterium sp. NMS12 TaxID=3079766 RepID=UPI003F88473A